MPEARSQPPVPLSRRGLHQRVESGLLSGIDLADDDPGAKLAVSVLKFQRDMFSENPRRASYITGAVLDAHRSYNA
ncbi:hypothetical protein [Nonomuraea maritima]|uniref:hypothetical protein n=1 Tax=Nonomuraea maritima TaxID=683260 RepID=UPI00371BF7D1